MVTGNSELHIESYGFILESVDKGVWWRHAML